jgi:N-acetylmuramic acid 6-phosphate etherase
MICNMLTTAAMAQLGYVYGNLMVNLHLKNEKLLERGISIVQRVCKVSRGVAIETLNSAEMKVPVALVMLRGKVSRTDAIQLLHQARGSVRKAIDASASATS